MDTLRFRPARFVVVVALNAAALVVSAAIGSMSLVSGATNRAVSCAGSAFYPTDSTTGYSTDGSLRSRQDGGVGGGFFRCDPGLPGGARVTRVQFTIRDDSETFHASGCSLRRTGLTTTTATKVDVMAVVPTTSGSPGIVRLTDDTIELATVNSSRYAYWLECHLGEDGLVGLYGASVNYSQ